MAWTDFVRRTGTVLADNSPAILTALAVAGTATTAYLTGRASFKAAQLLDDHETRVIRDNEEPLTTKEKVYFTWSLFIPPAVAGTATIAAIILANRIGARRAAALLAAYAISERAYEEYKDKIIDKIGARKESTYRDEIAQDRVTRHPPPSDLIWDEETNSVLCCDLFTGRYFFSDMESLRRAQNDINYEINNSYYASLTDFYERVGLDKTSMSDDFGWNADKLLELHFSTALTPSGRPCLTFDFKVMPIRGYARVQ